SVAVDIGGLVFHLECADSPLAEALALRFRDFPAASETSGFRVRLLDAAREHFVKPEEAPAGALNPLTLGWEGKVLLTQSYGFAGWADLESRNGAIALARAEFEKSIWCVENYLRVCTAWLALLEGGVLLHAASLVKDGHGHLFIGSSGSGK